jgi:DNA polymerase-3 subunit chi
MGAAYFYHLTRAPLEVTLPILLGKARGAGWRIAVRGIDLKYMEWLDEKLWLGPDDGFLAHGLAGGAHKSDQPILLGVEQKTANDPACIMTIGGADITAAEVEALERVCVLFDGNDPDAVDVARGQWKTLKDAGCKAQYWSEASGRWEKKAET